VQGLVHLPDWDLQIHEAQPGPHPELLGGYGAGRPAEHRRGGEIPYKPGALEKKKQNFEKRMTVDVSSDKTWHQVGDPELKCYSRECRRATYIPFL